MTTVERKIIEIDEDKCNGCGLCVDACHEGAIQMVNGKAKLVSDSYCDGLGDCLGPCPTGALSIVTRAAEAYDEEAVAARMRERGGPAAGGCPGAMARDLRKPADVPGTAPTPAVAASAPEPLACGCPGSMSKSLKAIPSESCCCGDSGCDGGGEAPAVASELMNWPVQLKLVPPSAPYLRGADILVAADCAPVAVPDFHSRYLRGKPVIIACPKLEDNAPQVEKLAEIVRVARPASLTVLRMEVPCCGGLVRVAEEAVRRSGLDVPVSVVVVNLDGSPQP